MGFFGYPHLMLRVINNLFYNIPMSSPEEKLKEQIAEYFIKCWKEQKFPADLKIKSYEDWRLFRMFWFEHCELELQPAINYYLAKNEQAKV